MHVELEFATPLPHCYNSPKPTMTYDDDNRLATFNGQSVTHDADGNMTYGPGTNNSFINYTYDARNRLIQVGTAGPGGPVSYTYDPAGNRIALSNATGVTRFVINPNAALSQVLMRIRPGVTNYYVYGLGLLYEVTETATNSYQRYYHYDYRGSTVALTDGNGNVTDRFEYSAYGTLTYRSGSTDTPFLFNGRYGVQTDPNGLLYMRARYYNPYICRFINPDPIGFAGGLNWYAYADGNPVSYLDPFGLCGQSEGFWSWLAGAGMGVLNTVGNILSVGMSSPDANFRRSVDLSVALALKYGASGYYEQYGGWNTALMIAGEFAGTTPFAEGIYGYDIGWGTPLSSFESGERTVSGSLQMASWVAAGYGMAKGFTGPTAAPAGGGSVGLEVGTMGKGIFYNGKIVAQAPIEAVTSHEALAGALVRTPPAAGTPGTLVQGAEAFTYVVTPNGIKITGSMNFNPTVSKAAQAAIIRQLQGGR